MPATASPALLDAWEEEQEEQAGQSADDHATLVACQYDLSIPPGRRVDGFASWHATDPSPMNCPTCAAPLHLLPTIGSIQ